MPIHAAQLQSTVLCLDDDEAVLELLEAFLPRQGAYEVRTTTDPDRGFELVADGAADLVVCDYKMGSCSGIDFLQRVRREGHDLPFVLFTGHATEDVSAAAERAGATDFVRKGGPERLDELVASLATAASRT
ncbi:response regulator [Halorarius litoreus]|uniref:response regulator n=1 Tax=Halorarius litoreus TaxID=2962676 RepID=UPI0020CE8A7F|nr:response regulator [Halorarius litoreus]